MSLHVFIYYYYILYFFIYFCNYPPTITSPSPVAASPQVAKSPLLTTATSPTKTLLVFAIIVAAQCGTTEGTLKQVP